MNPDPEAGLQAIADAIHDPLSSGERDATGNRVESLTDAVRGLTNGLVMIAGAINNLAQAVRTSREPKRQAPPQSPSAVDDTAIRLRNFLEAP
jgi:hypothetical protein